jgi:glycolate oxidase FAD binding subunit
VTVLSADDLEALRVALGDDAGLTHAPVEIGGAKLDVTLAPGAEDALARSIAVLAARGIGAIVRGGGTRSASGNTAQRARVVLSTQRLSRVLEVDAEEGVARALAGTPLSEIREAVDAAGWALPFDPPGAGTTLGGTLAAAAIGPRHLGFGRPRDLVLGMDVVLGDGVRTRCGGRVVKNVTGYDLMKLQVGAHGSFGVISAAWLRLRPRPECERVLAAALDERGDAMARAVAAARLPTARVCALVDTNFGFVVESNRAPRSGWLLIVEVAGDEAAVARDSARLSADFGAGDATRGVIDRVRSLQGANFGPAGLRFRLSVLPSRLDRALRELAGADAALLVYPGSGLVFARIALDSIADGIGVERAWLAMRSAARAGSGTAVLEAAPEWAKIARDVHGEATDEWRLARALKARFDPAGILNPGRFVGGL